MPSTGQTQTPASRTLMSRVWVRCAMSIVATASFAAASPIADTGVGAATSDTGVDTTTPAPDTTNDFLDLERSLAECISSNPPPGCGRVPTGPGDRGGWQQLTLFGVMMGGVAVIFWRVSRAVRKRDAQVNSD